MLKPKVPLVHALLAFCPGRWPPAHGGDVGDLEEVGDAVIDVPADFCAMSVTCS